MHLTSAANPRLKSIAALARKKDRAETGLFTAEGWEFISRALQAGWALNSLLHVQGHEHPLLQKAIAAADQVYTTTPALMSKVTGKSNPQPVLGVFRQKWAEPKVETSFWIVLEQPRDPGNVGSIIRTADAAGAGGVIFIGDPRSGLGAGSADPYSPDSVRATMGSIFAVPLAKLSEADFLAWRQAFNGPVIGTALDAGLDYRNAPAQRPALLLMGNEQQGLSPALQQACTHLVHIPMQGSAESLNLAAATAIMAFQLNRG